MLLKEVRATYQASEHVFLDSTKARAFCEMALHGQESEKFHVIYLDSQHRLIKDETMFHGTINSCAVYPREIAKRCLELNAAAVILCHNHPSGIPDPSDSDLRITKEIKQALGLFDITLLDHVIVGHTTLSLAQKGLM